MQNGGKAGEGNGESIELLWTGSLTWVKSVNLVFIPSAAISSQGMRSTHLFTKMPCDASVIGVMIGVELLTRIRTKGGSELSLGSHLCMRACKLIFTSTANQPVLRHLQQ